MVVRRGTIRTIWWVIKILEAQVGQFLLGYKCPVSREFFVQDQDHLGEPSEAFFLQNVLQLHQQRCIILRVDNLVLWKIIRDYDNALIPKIYKISIPADFWTRNFFGVGQSEKLCASTLIVAFFPDHIDITQFRPWPTIGTGNHSDCA